MSIKVMTYVWDGFPGAGSELLAMLAMADWCNDAGGSLYPSMRAVAEKIRVSEKQARRIVRSFEDAGYLAVVGNAYGGAPGTTKQFRLNVAMLKVLAEAKEQPHAFGETPPSGVTPPMGVTPPTDGTPPASVTPPLGVPDPSHGCPFTPPTYGSQSTIEPSENRDLNTGADAPADPAPVMPAKPATQKEPSVLLADKNLELPGWMPVEPWQQFEVIRWAKHSKKTPYTAYAQSLLVKKLRKLLDVGQDLTEILESSVRNSWTDVYATKTVQSRAFPARQTTTDRRTSTMDGLTGRNKPKDQHDIIEAESHLI